MKSFTLQGSTGILSSEWGKDQEAKAQLSNQPTRDGLPESNSYLLVQIKASLVISVLKQNPNKPKDKYALYTHLKLWQKTEKEQNMVKGKFEVNFIHGNRRFYQSLLNVIYS